MTAAPLTSSITRIGRASRPRVVCALEPDRADEDAVGRACEIAGRRGHVALVCVLDTSGGGDRGFSPARAASVLESAMRQVQSAGVMASVYLLRAPDPVDMLLRAAADGTALVVHGENAAAASIAAAAGLLDCPVTVVESAAAELA